MSLIRTEEIRTPRLALVSITPTTIRLEQAAQGKFQSLGKELQAKIHEQWPHAEWEPHVLEFLLKQFSDHPDQLGWHRYVLLVEPDGARTLIGCVGSFAKDDAYSTCEIGYGILPSFEGRGFATEATQALIRYLGADQRIMNLIAHTYPSLVRSIRVMEKCGLIFDGDGDEAGTVRYRLNLRR